jgi:polyisoprenyl-phosphate glycosyltransferase
MSDSTSVCIVAPAFNEEAVLGLFHERLAEQLELLPDRYTWRVVYVIDPSTDGTEDVARGIAAHEPRVSVLMMSRRVGHQVSLVAGMDACDEDVCITMDSDLQHPPELIADMLALYEAGADIVQTVRVATEGASRVKSSTSKSFYRMVNKVSEVKLVESGADFRLLSRRVLDVFQDDIREHNPFLRGLVQWTGFPSATLPFVAPERAAGEGKYSLRQSMGLALSGLVSFSKTPLRVGLIAGTVVAAVAVVVVLIGVIPGVFGEPVPAGWTTTALLIAILGSAQLLTIGLLGIYIGAIFDEVKKRPRYLVRDSVNVRPQQGRERA